jgi:pyridoxine/pyridoxamine 5'-phosphate oxidase
VHRRQSDILNYRLFCLIVFANLLKHDHTRNVSLPEYWSGFEAITGIMPFFAGIMPLYYALYYASRITRAAQIR